MTPDSVHRSLRRWVSMICEPPWTVLLDEKRETAEGDQRPVAVVLMVDPPVTTFGRATIPAGDRRRVAPFSVAAFLAADEDARTARLAAFDLASRFDDAIHVGLVEPTGVAGEPDRLFGGPLTLPLYDYEGVAVTGPRRAGPAEPVQMMDVVDFSVRALPDLEDVHLWSVQATLRLGWWSGGRARRNVAEDPAVTGVQPQFIP